MATSPFSEASYCKVLVPRPTHKRGRQGVAHDREPVERAAFRGSDGLEPPKSVTVRVFLNRGVARMQLFEKAADYQAFEQVLRDTLDQSPMRICAYTVMPNHWHLLLWPECDGELTAFMQRLTITHVRRWQEHRGYAGLGHVYQGRYKSFPVESDEHFWVVARYVERNALAPISSCERRNGGGQACGNAVILPEKSGRCWRRGRSICRRIGSSGSIKPTTRRNWKRCAAACNEAAPLLVFYTTIVSL